MRETFLVKGVFPGEMPDNFDSSALVFRPLVESEQELNEN